MTPTKVLKECFVPPSMNRFHRVLKKDIFQSPILYTLKTTTKKKQKGSVT